MPVSSKRGDPEFKRSRSITAGAKRVSAKTPHCSNSLSRRVFAILGELTGSQNAIGFVLMDNLLAGYLPLIIFIGVSAVIGLALLVAPFLVAYQRPDPEKLSAYECGFNAFDDARMKFDVRFYLVSILFIIFDLEVAFLFPWAITFKEVGLFGFTSMMIFLAVLTIGFVYEWKKGALEWD